MHLCFVDESGTPAKPQSNNSRFFVIAGLIIPEQRWSRVAKQLQGLKTRWQYHGELKWRFFSPNNTDSQNPMLNWEIADRNAFRESVFSIITGDKSLQIIAGICDAELAYTLPNVNDQSDIYFRTYKVVTERFQYYLQDITKASGTMFHGLIVADHRGRDDDKTIRDQHQRLVEQEGAYTSSYLNMIEGLFLQPSHQSVGIQLADMIAGGIWRQWGANDARWIEILRPSFRKSSSGRIDGYGIARFPKQGWTAHIEE